MGAVQQAVLEFDEEVRAPWRPRLAAVPDLPAAEAVPATRREVRPSSSGPHPARRSPSRGSSSRVGACRPQVSGPTSPARPAETPGTGVARPLRPRPAGPLRLTRRARRLAVVLALASGVAVGSWLAPLATGGDSGLRLAGESSVVVQGGDTLWSIASSVAGDADVRSVVDEIQRLNHLQGTDLVPGQVLQLP